MAKIEKVQSSELGVQRINLLWWTVSFIVVLISLANLSIWARNELAKKARIPIEVEISKWEQVVQKTPTYRDSYLKLAILYWQLQEDQKSQVALAIAENLDPNYEETGEIKRLLGY
ncbi:hypothetical protein HY404_02400 [Candidatus Microgenomates bacterium]|nr:hypothetical protein [Candidatus Microgenomates bacterium]